MTVPIPQTSSVAPGDPPVPAAAKHERLASLDAYRGAIMLLMASGGLGLSRIAQEFPDSALWQTIAHHTEHARWAGFTLWDIIQPAFMFMVGVACPFQSPTAAPAASIFSECSPTPFGAPSRSYSSPSSSPPHRAAVPFGSLPTSSPRSASATPPSSCRLHPPRTQWLAAFLILLVCWLAFIIYPLPTADFDWQSAGLTGDWPRLEGLAAHWEKNANIAAAFDRWFLNLFPREKPYTFTNGGYTTLNFVPSIATMVFGLLATNCPKVPAPSSPRSLPRCFSIAGIILSWAIAGRTLPMVKRLWTLLTIQRGWAAPIPPPSSLTIGAGRLKRLAFPHHRRRQSIALYCMWQLLGPFHQDQPGPHEPDLFDIFGPAYAPPPERSSSSSFGSHHPLDVPPQNLPPNRCGSCLWFLGPNDGDLHCSVYPVCPLPATTRRTSFSLAVQLAWEANARTLIIADAQR